MGQLKSNGTKAKREVLFQELTPEMKSLIKTRLGKAQSVTLTNHALSRINERWKASKTVQEVVRAMRKSNIARVCRDCPEVVFHYENKNEKHAWAIVVDLLADEWRVVTLWEYPKGGNDCHHVN